MFYNIKIFFIIKAVLFKRLIISGVDQRLSIHVLSMKEEVRCKKGHVIPFKLCFSA